MQRIDIVDAFDALKHDCLTMGGSLPFEDFERGCRYMANQLGTIEGAESESDLNWLLTKNLRFAAAWSLIPPDWSVELRRDKNGNAAVAIQAPCQQKSVTVDTSEVGAAILAALTMSIIDGPSVAETSVADRLPSGGPVISLFA
jgi:hypothetical protein